MSKSRSAILTALIITSLTILGAAVGAYFGVRASYRSMVTSNEPLGHSIVGIVNLALGAGQGVTVGATYGAMLYPAWLALKHMYAQTPTWGRDIWRWFASKSSARPRRQISASEDDEVHKALEQLGE